MEVIDTERPMVQDDHRETEKEQESRDVEPRLIMLEPKHQPQKSIDHARRIGGSMVMKDQNKAKSKSEVKIEEEKVIKNMDQG